MEEKKISNKKTRVIFSTTEDEAKKIKELAQKLGMSMSAYIRWCILYSPKKARKEKDGTEKDVYAL